MMISLSEYHKVKPINTPCPSGNQDPFPKLVISHWGEKEEQEGKCLEKQPWVLEFNHTNCL